VKIVFDDIKSEKIISEEVETIKNIIPKLKVLLEENLESYFQFLSEQEKNGNYIEIHWPFFEFGITLMLSKIKHKFLISVLNYRDLIVYGNLLIDGYVCISNDELKKLGQWQNYSDKKLKILKPF